MKTSLTLLTIIASFLALSLVPIGEAKAQAGINSEFANTQSDALSHFNAPAPSTGMMGNTNRQALKVSSRKQAASLAQARYKAKVLSVNSSKVNGNPGYRVKLLGNNGTVFYVLIDAKTGQMKRA